MITDIRPILIEQLGRAIIGKFAYSTFEQAMYRLEEEEARQYSPTPRILTDTSADSESLFLDYAFREMDSGFWEGNVHKDNQDPWDRCFTVPLRSTRRQFHLDVGIEFLLEGYLSLLWDYEDVGSDKYKKLLKYPFDGHLGHDIALFQKVIKDNGTASDFKSVAACSLNNLEDFVTNLRQQKKLLDLYYGKSSTLPKSIFEKIISDDFGYDESSFIDQEMEDVDEEVYPYIRICLPEDMTSEQRELYYDDDGYLGLGKGEGMDYIQEIINKMPQDEFDDSIRVY
jgi:hypothetical protein